MYLADSVYLTPVGDRAVVLDLNKDKYIGLGADTARAARELLDGGTDDSLQTFKARLIAQGILSERPRAGPPVIPHAETSLWPDLATAHPVRSQSLSSLRALAGVALSLRVRRFRDTVDWLRREKRHQRGPESETANLLTAFQLSRPWFPIKPICRLDAPALCLHLWRNGQDADLVFGVRLEQFSAHCWAQSRGVVLNDTRDNVRQFTPIMAV
jgi:hypothetical protein